MDNNFEDLDFPQDNRPRDEFGNVIHEKNSNEQSSVISNLDNKSEKSSKLNLMSNNLYKKSKSNHKVDNVTIKSTNKRKARIKLLKTLASITAAAAVFGTFSSAIISGLYKKSEIKDAQKEYIARAIEDKDIANQMIKDLQNQGYNNIQSKYLTYDYFYEYGTDDEMDEFRDSSEVRNYFSSTSTNLDYLLGLDGIMLENDAEDKAKSLGTTTDESIKKALDETNTFNQISEYLDDLGYTWEMSKVITLKNFDTEAYYNYLESSEIKSLYTSNDVSYDNEFLYTREKLVKNTIEDQTEKIMEKGENRNGR